ncbi:hypothetical protein D3C86_1792840 [compost metagenome]
MPFMMSGLTEIWPAPIVDDAGSIRLTKKSRPLTVPSVREPARCKALTSWAS